MARVSHLSPQPRPHERQSSRVNPNWCPQLVQVDINNASDSLFIYISRLLTPLMSCTMKDFAKAGVI